MATLTERAREIWAGQAGFDFPAPGAVAVGVAAESGLCPPGWAGMVVIGGAAVVTVPEARYLDAVRAAVTAPDVGLIGRLPVAEVLGPATLAYAGAVTGLGPCERLPAAHPDVAALVAAVPAAEAGESALDELTSDAFLLREGARVVAVAGYARWEPAVAHLSVLTAVDRRGRGLARVVAAAAAADALAAGLLPQWRARPVASRRVARAIGFVELGEQVSVRW
jgi:hypothetical protein